MDSYRSADYDLFMRSIAIPTLLSIGLLTFSLDQLLALSRMFISLLLLVSIGFIKRFRMLTKVIGLSRTFTHYLDSGKNYGRARYLFPIHCWILLSCFSNNVIGSSCTLCYMHLRQEFEGSRDHIFHHSPLPSLAKAIAVLHMLSSTTPPELSPLSASLPTVLIAPYRPSYSRGASNINPRHNLLHCYFLRSNFNLCFDSVCSSYDFKSLFLQIAF